MNKNYFKKNICSYCQNNLKCCKNKIEYIKINKIKILKCNTYIKK